MAKATTSWGRQPAVATLCAAPLATRFNSYTTAHPQQSRNKLSRYLPVGLHARLACNECLEVSESGCIIQTHQPGRESARSPRNFKVKRHGSRGRLLLAATLAVSRDLWQDTRSGEEVWRQRRGWCSVLGARIFSTAEFMWPGSPTPSGITLMQPRPHPFSF